MNSNIRYRLKKIRLNFSYLFNKRYRNKQKIIRSFSGHVPPVNIFDIGASYFPHMKWDVFINSNNTFWHAVDPNEKNLEYADTWRYKSKVKKLPFAISENGGLKTLYKTRIDSGSSTLKINISENSKHRVVTSNLFPLKEIKLKTTTLQKLIEKYCEIDIDFILKLDTQGTEFNILKSMNSDLLFKNVICVELENTVMAEPIYEKSTSISEVFNFFTKNEFELVQIDVIDSVYPKVSGQLYNKNVPSECDWIFIKKYSKISKASLRKKILILGCYISYNLFGEAGNLIENILSKNQLEINNELKKSLIFIKKIINIKLIKE